MNPEDKKYIWWGLLGIGVAALFYFLSSKNSGKTNTVTVPYLVPQTTNGASPSADTSLSNQPNIVGSSPNSTIPNFSNPLGVATSVGEAPNTWGFMPQLIYTPVNTVQNRINGAAWPSSNGATNPSNPPYGGFLQDQSYPAFTQTFTPNNPGG